MGNSIPYTPVTNPNKEDSEDKEERKPTGAKNVKN